MKEILSHDTTWMNLKDTVLSEVSQAQKDECCMIRSIYLYEVSKLVKSLETESRMGLAGAGGWKGSCSVGVEF